MAFNFQNKTLPCLLQLTRQTAAPCVIAQNKDQSSSYLRATVMSLPGKKCGEMTSTKLSPNPTDRHCMVQLGLI